MRQRRAVGQNRLGGVEDQLITRRPPADQNARKPPRHAQELRATSPTKS
jgi:hypothetical protein